MINYLNKDKWLILRYRPGSGGKFLSCCLLTINNVAHWDQRVEYNTLSFVDWVDTLWNDSNIWFISEPMHEWNTTFFSRTFPRGNDLSLDDYNIQMNEHTTEYFNYVWKSNKLILDVYHRTDLPGWWQGSKNINLDARRNCPIHKKMLLAKLYPFNEQTNIGVSLMDKPLDYNTNNSTQYESNINAIKYCNQWEFGPFENKDQWYQQIWDNDFRINFPIGHVDFYLDQLFDFDQLNKFIATVASDLNSEYDKDNLQYIHNFWLDKSKKYANLIDTA